MATFEVTHVSEAVVQRTARTESHFCLYPSYITFINVDFGDHLNQALRFADVVATLDSSNGNYGRG